MEISINIISCSFFSFCINILNIQLDFLIMSESLELASRVFILSLVIYYDILIRNEYNK